MNRRVARAQPPQAIRLWRWRRNPLRRSSDLLQAWIGLILVIAVVAAAPWTAILVGTAAHRALHQHAREEARSKHRTTAVVLRQVPEYPGPGPHHAAGSPADVRFTGPDGRTRTASTEVMSGLAAGSRVEVWTDAEGELTDPPPTSGEILSRAIGWGSLAALGVVLAGAACYAAIGRVLDRRRFAQWGQAWLWASIGRS